MTADLEALLTALYVLIDDHVIPPGQRRPGRPKKLSDAELVCLAVAQVLLGARSEHHDTHQTFGSLPAGGEPGSVPPGTGPSWHQQFQQS